MGSFLARVLAEQDGTPSTKRICYALSVVAVLAFTGGYTIRKGMDDRVVDLSSRLESALGDQNLAVEGWQKAAAQQVERSRRAQEEVARINQRAAERVAHILAEPMPRTPDEAQAWAIRKARELSGDAQ